MLKFRDVAACVCGDRVRILTAPLVIAWLVWLSGRYAHFSVVAQPGYAGCLADPPSCEDHTLYMALWRVVDVGEGS